MTCKHIQDTDYMYRVKILDADGVNYFIPKRFNEVSAVHIPYRGTLYSYFTLILCVLDREDGTRSMLWHIGPEGQGTNREEVVRERAERIREYIDTFHLEILEKLKK